MFSRRRVLLASAALFGSSRLALAAASRNLLELRVEYSATSLIGTGRRTMSGRLWRSPRALRHEGNPHDRAVTVIVRLDRNLCWLEMADPGITIETDLSALGVPLDVLKGGGDMRQIRERREPANGLDTLRIRVERNARWGSRFTGHVWATDQGVIARIAGEGENHGQRGRTLMNFRDVQVGPLDPGLFEAPRDAQIVRVTGVDLATLLEGMDGAGQIGKRR
jgi:hypothetical protein